jgi:hypothetical protein
MTLYNYKYVIENILPVMTPSQRAAFGSDFATALASWDPSMNPPWAPLAHLVPTRDIFFNILQDVTYFVSKPYLFKNMPQKHRNLWNAYCLTYWGYDKLKQCVVDQWGYIKWKDIGYEPTLITTQEQADMTSMLKNNSAESAYTSLDADVEIQRIMYQANIQRRIDQLDNKKYRNLGVDIDKGH